VAIARTLLKAPVIVLLDEATSALGKIIIYFFDFI
jgi:ABC-type transport system involved in Fe-S cluster assembly fused permease/ATPase subunit